jgi:hypothetical protein
MERAAFSRCFLGSHGGRGPRGHGRAGAERPPWPGSALAAIRTEDDVVSVHGAMGVHKEMLGNRVGIQHATTVYEH